MRLDMTFAESDQTFPAYFGQVQAVTAVVSVNGKTGAVQLTAQDVGAISNADRQSLVSDVLNALPKWDGGEY